MASSDLRGLVSLSSASTKISITSLNPRHGRILPCIFQDKANVALRVADSALIPDESIDEIMVVLRRFKAVCNDYGVNKTGIVVTATSSVNTLRNFDKLASLIETELGLEVHRLDKQTEDTFHMFGLASSYYQPCGMFVEMKMNCCRINWILCKDEMRAGPNPCEIPFGFNNLVDLVRKGSAEEFEEVAREICDAVKVAVKKLEIPQELMDIADETGGHKLYLYGIGFRALSQWSSVRNPKYPLPIISGFACRPEFFEEELKVECVLDAQKQRNLSEMAILRARASAFMGKTLYAALPPLRKVLYCENTMRDGVLFHLLPPQIRIQDPLVVATQPYALPGAFKLAKVLLRALPHDAPVLISQRLVPALTNASYIHSSYPREMQSYLGLLVGTSGVISGAHGLSHCVRVLLGLALCNRWGGELAPRLRPLRKSFIQVPIERETAWWALYLGHVMYLVGGAFPGAHVRDHVLDFEVQGDGNDFNLVITRYNTIFGNNVVINERLDGLQARLDSLPAETGVDIHVTAVINSRD